MIEELNIKPFIVGIGMVKNEEDVIEQFVRHNLHYIDLLLILENGSVDSTGKILRSLQQEGLPVVIIDDPDPSYNQSEKMTRLMQNAAVTLFPDYIIPIDADEFIKAPNKEAFLVDLAEIPSPGKGFVRFHTYVVSEKQPDPPPPDPLAPMTRRRKDERSQTRKVIIRLDGQLPANLSIAMGNHEAIGLNKGIDLKHTCYAHFPVRSKDQLVEKTITGWMAYLLRNPMARYSREGYHWYDLFRKVKEGGEIDDRDLLRNSICYTLEECGDWEQNIMEDPFHFNYGSLKYSPYRESNSLAKIARTIEKNLAVERNEFAEELNVKLKALEIEAPELKNKTSATVKEVFEDNWHLENFMLDIPPTRDLYNKFFPSSVLDVGCGAGQYLAYFKHRGADIITGIDGISPGATLLEGDEFIQKDLNQGLRLGLKYDLVVCLGVMEHLEDAAALRLMRDIATHAGKIILFSTAEPGQPGHGHINCLPMGTWLDRWEQLGWEPLWLETITFRILASFSFLKRNTMVLAPKKTGHPAASTFLQKISDKPFPVWRQQPGIIESPMKNEYFESLNEALIGQRKSTGAISKEPELFLEIEPSQLILKKNIDSPVIKDKSIFFRAINEDPIIILPEIPPGPVDLHIRVELEVPEECILQLFYLTDIAAGYSEENSLMVRLKKGQQVVNLPLPAGKLKMPLRLDPGNVPGAYAIHSIKIMG